VISGERHRLLLEVAEERRLIGNDLMTARKYFVKH
jgi:hypothetical protein